MRSINSSSNSQARTSGHPTDSTRRNVAAVHPCTLAGPLVLAPREIGTHHKDDIVSHSCDIDGSAYGVVEGSKADIRDWSKVSVECTHY